LVAAIEQRYLPVIARSTPPNEAVNRVSRP
jgi:hypothetical protein